MLINSISLKNFKCFEELDVKFAPITLLTGANSSGKSSLINAILALLQTERFPFYLSPNGKYVNMGSFEEMVYDRNIKNDISINIHSSESFYRDFTPIFEWIWKYDIMNSLPKLKMLCLKFEQDRLVHENWELYVSETKDSLYDLNLYVKAPDVRFTDSIRNKFERIESLVGYIKPLERNYPDIRLEIKKSFHDLNQVFELYMHPDFIFKNAFLGKFIDKNFNYIGSYRQPPERTYYQKAKAQSKVDTDGIGYIDQIIEWEETDPEKFSELSVLMQDLELVTDIKSNNLKGGRFELNIKTHPKATFSSLTDVGFGVSQFLPVIVADLQLPDKSCLAVSQPEIHLHPKIQAQFGNYLANQIKRTEKQYIIETHSEYLLNRIRLLLTTGELKPEHVRVLYFENDGIKSTVYNVEFATDGQIKGAPTGFFDTYGIDVMDIALNAH